MTKTPEVSAADRDTGIRARIDKAVLDATADLVRWPRHLHEHPELSNREALGCHEPAARRPDVAFKAMSDDTARFQVNHAQVERSRQARDQFKDTSPVAPAVRHIDRTVEFLDLVTACHSFVAAAGRAVPGLRDRTLGEDERTIVHENVAKVRATLDWIETAVDTGKVDMDGELARLLKGE